LFNNALESSPSVFFMSEVPLASQLDNSVRNFLNSGFFSMVKIDVPQGYVDLFALSPPAIIADRGVFALLLGTIVITSFGAIRSWIPAIYLFVFGLLTSFAGALPYGGEVWNGDVIFALCSGGTLAAAFFLTSDPATGAKSSLVMVVVAAFGGGIAFIFRFWGLEPYGAVFGAIFINAMLPLVRILESRSIYERRGALTHER
jgi:electron transport complex protein RnfD